MIKRRTEVPLLLEECNQIYTFMHQPAFFVSLRDFEFGFVDFVGEFLEFGIPDDFRFDSGFHADVDGAFGR